jgi:hypothetical protein
MAITASFSFYYDRLGNIYPTTKYTVELSVGDLSICVLEKDPPLNWEGDDRQGNCYAEVERISIDVFLSDSKGGKILPQFFKAVEFVEMAFSMQSEGSVVAKSSPCTEVFFGDNGGSNICTSPQFSFVLRGSTELEFNVINSGKPTSITFCDDAIPAFFDAVNKAKNIVNKSANYFLTGLDIP